MSFLWDSFKNKAQEALSTGAEQTHKAKLKADILLLERQATNRKQAFGVELYDYVSPLAKNPNFFASDDSLTTTLRPALLTAQREVAALEIKLNKQREAIEQAKVNRAATFANKATTWQEQVINAGKSAALGTNEAKLATERAMLETRIKAEKGTFGVTLYDILEEKEDKQGWLPTDREIRSIYDQCRKDVEKVKKAIYAKQQEIGGGSATGSAPSSGNGFTSQPTPTRTLQPSQTAYPSAPTSLPPAAPPPPAYPSYNTPMYGSTQATSYTAPAPSYAPPQNPQYSAPAAPPAPQSGLFAGIPGAQADPFATDPFANNDDPFASIDLGRSNNNNSNNNNHQGGHDFLI